MSLSIGIVGLPNVGKSTLFNALLQKQQALAANYPFATIDPNVGIVGVPDDRLEKLAEIIENSRKTTPSPSLERRGIIPLVPATVTFVDIAGLVKGASEGQGLGNKFLAHIRETDAICHVLRGFSDENVIREGATDPVSDLSLIRTELAIADLATLEKQKEPKGKVEKEETLRWNAIQKIKPVLLNGQLASSVSLSDEEAEAAKSLFLLTMKPELFVINVDESELSKSQQIVEAFIKALKESDGLSDINPDQVVVICAQVEGELAALEPAEKKEYLESFGLEQSGLERLITAGYRTLRLMSFLTAGEKEVRAWTIRQGMTAPQAAGVIHTDFEQKFIKAKVCYFNDFVEYGGWSKASEAGKVRMEGREYVMQENDVVEFMVGS